MQLTTETGVQSPAVPQVKAKLLEGKKGLVIGIANENSIAWGCAKAFRAFGAELAVTYLNDKAKKYVEHGGFLYASVASDGAIPVMISLFGARLVDRAPSSEVTLKFVEPFGDFKPGDTLHYMVPSASIESWGALVEVHGGKVIAVDQDGHPALVTNTVGEGKTLLSAYPLEHYLASVPAVFDQTEGTHRIYAAFRDWSGIKPLFQVDQPAVEISALRGDHRGYVVLINHSASAQDTNVSTRVRIQSISQIEAEESKPLTLEKSGWKIHLEPYDAALVEWKE